MEIDTERFDRQAAWQRAWADTSQWTTKRLRGYLVLGSGSVITTAWVGYVASHHGHPADRTRDIGSTQLPMAAQVILTMLAFVTGGFLTFLILTATRFTVTPAKQRDEARNAVDIERETRQAEREAAATAVASRPIHSIHETNLRACFSTLVGCVGNNLAIKYGDPDRPVLGRAFAIHFPECAALIEDYQTARAAEAVALATYEERFGSLATERGFDEAPYINSDARNMVWTELRRAVVNGEFNDLDWQHGDEGREFRVFSRTHSWPVTGPISDEQFTAIKADLELLFSDGLIMPEAGSLTEAQTVRYKATIAAIRGLDEHRDVPITRRADCSQCQDH